MIQKHSAMYDAIILKNQPGFNYFCAHVAGKRSCNVIVHASIFYSSVQSLATADGIRPPSYAVDLLKQHVVANPNTLTSDLSSMT